jgi:hypothetical protein
MKPLPTSYSPITQLPTYYLINYLHIYYLFAYLPIANPNLLVLSIYNLPTYMPKALTYLIHLAHIVCSMSCHP